MEVSRGIHLRCACTELRFIHYTRGCTNIVRGARVHNTRTSALSMIDAKCVCVSPSGVVFNNGEFHQIDSFRINYIDTIAACTRSSMRVAITVNFVTENKYDAARRAVERVASESTGFDVLRACFMAVRALNCVGCSVRRLLRKVEVYG